MNKHRVLLADGTYATRNSKARVYTHATIMRVGEKFDPSTVSPGASAMYRDRRPGDEVVLAWHMTRDAASRYLHSAESERERVFYRASVRFATVELLEEPRKATCVNAEEPVSCLHKQGTPTKGSTMNKHRVILADGTEATRNSANRVYTHATIVTAADGSEGALSWHMTKASGDKYVRSSQAAATAAHYQGSVRLVEVELLPAKTRKAPSAKVAEPVQEAPVEAPVEPMPADSQDAAQEAEEAPAKDATDEILALLGGGILDDSRVRLRKAEATAEEAPAKKKQTTRMLKVECAQGSGYKVRLARSWLDSFGAPSCPCHADVMVGE